MSESGNKLFLIKPTHTVIFLFVFTCTVYILYAGVTRTYNCSAISAALVEGVVLIMNR